MPLGGTLDTLLPADGATVMEHYCELEALGYAGLWVAETNHDPFLPLALAARATTTATIGTAIAVAFARSPMTLAYTGWDLNEQSAGRFILGLGSQVKPHIERRFSMPWSHPAARMRELVLALRSIWDSWQTGSPLEFRGDFYSHTLMTPMFSPPSNGFGPPKIFLAAMEEHMLGVAGEVGDGLIVHPFTSSHYLDEVIVPAVDVGLRRAGRDRSSFEIMVMPIVVTGTSDDEIAAAAAGARKQLAFYASTPAYRRVLDMHGWGALQPELNELTKRGSWDAMATSIDDEMLSTYAVVAPLDGLATELTSRFGATADRLIANLKFSQRPGLDRELLGHFSIVHAGSTGAKENG